MEIELDERVVEAVALRRLAPLDARASRLHQLALTEDDVALTASCTRRLAQPCRIVRAAKHEQRLSVGVELRAPRMDVILLLARHRIRSEEYLDQLLVLVVGRREQV
eukprot:701377-Prymnesium_polylepis.1